LPHRHLSQALGWGSFFRGLETKAGWNLDKQKVEKLDFRPAEIEIRN
jgi:hypothetical protein